MSRLGSVQNKIVGFINSARPKGAGSLDYDPLGIFTGPYDQQKQMEKNAKTLADQQAADAAAASNGPQAMAVRDQQFAGASADLVTSTGNEADAAGTALGANPRRRGARRVLVG